MTDEATTAETQVDGGDASQSVDTSQETPQGNPAWDTVRSELDPISFSKIEPHLKSWDANVQKRIEQSNSKYAPYQQLLEGRDPESLQKAVAYAEMLDQDPESVYQKLGEFLQATGRMPKSTEELQAADDAGVLDGEDSQQTPTDPRIDQLMQQQQILLDRLGQQQQAEAVAQANQSLEAEISALSQAHPELSQDDTQEIIRRAAFAAQANPGQDIDFAKALGAAYQEFSALKNRILSTPRPGDSAPQLPPISGGTPTAPNQQQKSWGQYTDAEIQNFIAGGIAQNK